MNRLGKHHTINEWVKEDMSRTAVFQELDIDFCCGGEQTLHDACREKGLDLDAVLERLSPASAEKPVDSVKDWGSVSVQELADHIESTHHVYLREAMPVLTDLLKKVVQAHGEHHPELAQLQSSVSELFSDFQSHLMKEERILFPMIRNMFLKAPAGEYFCTNFQGPVLAMQSEHDRVDRLLEEIRRLTDDYQMPADGCKTYRLMLDRLKELELDLHVHIHKENDILFPGILDLERSQQVV